MKKIKGGRTFLMVFFIFYCGFSQAMSSGPLKVGASKVSITPPDNMFPMTNLQNFGGVHDSIFVRTIVLDNGHMCAALMSLDLISVPGGDDFINALASELGTETENIFISAIHSHNTPFVLPPKVPGSSSAQTAAWRQPTPESEEYYNQVMAAAVESIRKAKASMQPARVGFAEGKAYVNTNRDEKIGEGYHMGYNPDGPSDKTVAVISFTNQEGEPIAVYANYPVHAVVMFRAKTKDGKPEVTGDIGGATSAYVEKSLNDVVALWTSGAAGDQNPLFMANYNQDAPDVFDEGSAGYAILDVQARRLGEEIVRLTKSTQNITSDVKLWTSEATFTHPGRKRANPPEAGVPTQGYQAPARIEMIDGDPVTIPLKLFMINDIALAGVSGEVFTEIGIHLKEQSVFDRTVMVTNLPNGVGYIPTEAAYLLPSEKAITNRLQPGAEYPLIESFLGLMNKYISENNLKSSGE